MSAFATSTYSTSTSVGQDVLIPSTNQTRVGLSSSPGGRSADVRCGKGAEGPDDVRSPETRVSDTASRRMSTLDCLRFLLEVEAEIQRRIDLLQDENERYLTLLLHVRRAARPSRAGPAAEGASADDTHISRISRIDVAPRSTPSRNDEVGSSKPPIAAPAAVAYAQPIQKSQIKSDQMSGAMDELDRVLAQAKSIRSKERPARKAGPSKAQAEAVPARRARDTYHTASAPIRSAKSGAAAKPLSESTKRESYAATRPGYHTADALSAPSSSSVEEEGNREGATLKPGCGADTAQGSESMRKTAAAPENSVENISLSQSIKKIDSAIFEKVVSELNYTSAEVMSSQTRFLSMVQGRLSVPNSLPYIVANEGLEFMPRPATHFSEGSSVDNLDAALSELSAVLVAHKNRYEKRYRRLVQELSFSSLSAAERQDIFNMWYDIHHIIDLYESLVRSNDPPAPAIPDEKDRSIDDALRMIADLPLFAPVDLYSSTPREVLEPGWLKRNLTQTELFNNALCSRVRFASETVISRTLMRDLIAEMKKCTINSKGVRMGIMSDPKHSTSASPPGADDLAGWTAAMGKYRDVWSCLADARHDGMVSFVYK